MLSVGRFDPAQLEFDPHSVAAEHDCDGHNCSHPQHAAGHGQSFGTWSYTTDEPIALETAIDGIAGVVTNGLFARRGADVLLVGGDAGVERRER